MKFLKNIIQIILIIIITIGCKEIAVTFNSKNITIILFIIYLSIIVYILFKNMIIDKKIDRMIRKAGKDGEDKVKKILKTLNKKDYKIMNGFYLKGNNLTQELDSIVISSKGIFNIEVKNFSGNITINKSGEWIRTKYDKIETIKNPKEQIERHHKVIKDVVGNNINIVDILVIANDSATFLIKGNINYKVLLYKDLKDYINSYKSNYKYNVGELEKNILNRKTGDSSILKYKEKINRTLLDKIIIYLKIICVTCSIIYFILNVKVF